LPVCTNEASAGKVTDITQFDSKRDYGKTELQDLAKRDEHNMVGLVGEL
jgi:hypothetical protein